MTLDERWMRLALDIAEMGRGQTDPNPLVGAVVVKDGLVVGQGAHLKAGHPHAEVNALQMAGEMAQAATIYVTLEPCNHHGRTPPCTEAIIDSGIHRVVIATVDHDARTHTQGIARLQNAGIDVTVGVLESLAIQQNRAFFHRVDTNRPLVVYKTAATLSGHVAASSGHSQFVTSDAAREDVQTLRMSHSGIAVGVGTILADDPKLTVRYAMDNTSHPLPAPRQPVRVIFDSHGRTPTTAQLLREPGRTLVIVGETVRRTAPDYLQTLLELDGVEIVVVSEVGSGKVASDNVGSDKVDPDKVNGRVHLGEALRRVAEAGVNSLLVEGGPTLAGALLDNRLIDEVCLYFAPKLLRNGLPMFNGLPTSSMRDSVYLENVSYKPIGDNLRIDATVHYDIDESASVSQ